MFCYIYKYFRVQQDICCSLGLKNPFLHVGSFDRPNLFYGAKCCENSKHFLDELNLHMSDRRKAEESTIVYCATIRDAEDVCIHFVIF
jgi:ATP-dependent DNA helicase RecQ